MNLKCRAVLLAAGGSRRFGSPKLLAMWQREPILWRALDALSDTELDERCLVVGFQSEALQACYDQWCLSRRKPHGFFEVRVNASWQQGFSTSLRRGLSGNVLERSTMVVLGDQPRVTAVHLSALLSASKEGFDVVASDYDGTAGVPAWFAPSAQAALLKLQGDMGARAVLNSPSELRIRTLPFAAVERVDIDVPEDLLSL
jgi:molybdenum cofactor cytidylyltransferase